MVTTWVLLFITGMCLFYAAKQSRLNIIVRQLAFIIGFALVFSACILFGMAIQKGSILGVGIGATIAFVIIKGAFISNLRTKPFVAEAVQPEKSEAIVTF